MTFEECAAPSRDDGFGMIGKKQAKDDDRRFGRCLDALGVPPRRGMTFEECVAQAEE